MRKISFIIKISFLTVTLLVNGCSIQTYNKSNFSYNSKTKEGYNNPNDRSINQVSNNKIANFPTYPPIYLPILGESKNLTSSEKISMNIWRNTIIELAKQNKTSLFINGSNGKKQIALTFDDGPLAHIRM